MPTFSGKFQYMNADGTAAQAGPCRVTFDKETFTLTPASGTPLVFDLGDIDALLPAEYELTLVLYTGKKVVLSQFAKSFQDLRHDLVEAYRNRLVQCLLLEDLEEITRFDGAFHMDGAEAATPGGRAEFRLYKSNLAVLPASGVGFQWRLADIDAVDFDEANYTVTVESEGKRLTVNKLAKRTREFKERLDDSIARLIEKGAKAVHDLFPFLTPDELGAAAGMMKEGHAAALARLKGIDSKTEQAVLSNIVDEQFQPYFDALMKHSQTGWVYAGFKLLRKDEDEEKKETAKDSGEEKEPEIESAEETEEKTEDKKAPAKSARKGGEKPRKDEEEESPILYWLFFVLAAESGAKSPGNLVAWEATSKSGRATYFFRLTPAEGAHFAPSPAPGSTPVDSAIHDLNRAIVLLNFRREPIYLPDESLDLQPRFHRYVIACRKLPELRRLRASFVGRAIHSSPEAWQKQFEEILAKI